MSGAGVVLPEGDQAEVERRVVDLHEDMQPRTRLGSILIRKIATDSVRSERAAERENAQIEERKRNAVDRFDEERGRRVDELVAAFHETPLASLRNLRRMPEGVDRLLKNWRMLRRDLAREERPRWDSSDLALAANLSGVHHLSAQEIRIGELSAAFWGDFSRLTAAEGGGLDEEGRREWARVALLEEIDGIIAELEEHRETLDLDRIEQDRREAPLRCTFDDSKQASLARRYEADANRGFYKALKEFRQVEAEAAERIEAEPAPSEPSPPSSRSGSFRETTPPAARERPRAYLDDPTLENPPVRTSEMRPKDRNRPLPPPG